MKKLIVAVFAMWTVGCATLTSDAMTPVALSFGDGSNGECRLTNKRGDWSADIPSTVSIRRSDDSLKYDCKTEDGREAVGSIPSTVGAKIVASAVFIDFGITDAITDKHREYPASFVIPIGARTGSPAGSGNTDENLESKDVYAKLQELNDLREKGILTDAEFDSEKKKLLDAE
jgi:Short C-terminal domain